MNGLYSCRKTTVSSRNLDDCPMYVLGVAGGTAVAGANICIRFDAFTGCINPYNFVAFCAVIFDGADRTRLPCILGVTYSNYNKIFIYVYSFISQVLI